MHYLSDMVSQAKGFPFMCASSEDISKWLSGSVEYMNRHGIKAMYGTHYAINMTRVLCRYAHIVADAASGEIRARSEMGDEIRDDERLLFHSLEHASTVNAAMRRVISDLRLSLDAIDYGEGTGAYAYVSNRDGRVLRHDGFPLIAVTGRVLGMFASGGGAFPRPVEFLESYKNEDSGRHEIRAAHPLGGVELGVGSLGEYGSAELEEAYIRSLSLISAVQALTLTVSSSSDMLTYAETTGDSACDTDDPIIPPMVGCGLVNSEAPEHMLWFSLVAIGREDNGSYCFELYEGGEGGGESRVPLLIIVDTLAGAIPDKETVGKIARGYIERAERAASVIKSETESGGRRAISAIVDPNKSIGGSAEYIIRTGRGIKIRPPDGE